MRQHDSYRRGRVLAAGAERRFRLGGRVLTSALAWLMLATTATASASVTSFANVIDSVQPKIVKIYGAGGIRRLEAYQSGILISSDGHILTVWSYVLDTDTVTVILNDGRKFEATLVGHDPRIEVAILKIEAQELPYFDTADTKELVTGDRVLAFSNLFGVATGNEQASVMHGSVSATTDLAARRGAFETTYDGPVFVLDAMTNNPGASGGALTDRRGQLAGLLGKELRNSLTNTWLNYAIPISVLTQSIDDILAHRLISSGPDNTRRKTLEPITMALLGITLVPDVLHKTPPFIDRIRPDSPAERAGLRADDLVLFVNEKIASSCKVLSEELAYIDRDDPLRLTVQRGQQLLEVELISDN